MGHAAAHLLTTPIMHHATTIVTAIWHRDNVSHELACPAIPPLAAHEVQARAAPPMSDSTLSTKPGAPIIDKEPSIYEHIAASKR